jgi:NitT/TauT family transport system substrate-binding protein
MRSKLSLGSPPELKEWSAWLRAASAAELPSTMTPEDRARMVLELVDTMRRVESAPPARRVPADDGSPELGPPNRNGTAARPRPQVSEMPVRHSSPLPPRDRRRAASAGDPSWSRRTHRMSRPLQAGLIVVAVVALVAAGGVFTSKLMRGDEIVGGNANPVTTKIRVGVLPVVDVAPFEQAVKAGYFAQEGLEVETVINTSGPAAIGDLIAGRLDVAFTSYPGMMKAQSDKQADIKIIAPAYTALPGHLMLVAPPNGAISKAEDVAGKQIAVTSTNTISDLVVMSELKARNVDFTTVRFVEMAMPAMGAAMQRGEIDGAVLAEPYITLTDKEFHARPILDVAVGKTARIPVSGYATLSRFEREQPQAAAAFVRALNRGVDDVADRNILEPLLVDYLKINDETARVVRVAEYTKGLDPAQIQRVADLMREFDVIRQPLDVRPMLFSP